MNKKTKIGILGLAGSAAIGGAVWFMQPNKKPPKSEPECVSSLSYPSRIVALQDPKDGLWKAQLTVRPPNAPCWMSYSAKAVDDKGGVGVSKPIIIHVK